MVRKFIAERIITYLCVNENPGILLTKREFHLQTGNPGYKTGVLYYKWDSRLTIYLISANIRRYQ